MLFVTLDHPSSNLAKIVCTPFDVAQRSILSGRASSDTLGGFLNTAGRHSCSFVALSCMHISFRPKQKRQQGAQHNEKISHLSGCQTQISSLQCKLTLAMVVMTVRQKGKVNTVVQRGSMCTYHEGSMDIGEHNFGK